MNVRLVDPLFPSCTLGELIDIFDCVSWANAGGCNSNNIREAVTTESHVVRFSVFSNKRESVGRGGGFSMRTVCETIHTVSSRMILHQSSAQEIY